ncbi:hypothetical protein BHM03_00057353 [Ensete ventricosum]|uniref:Coatomer subunit epsilon n=1 Tax=Ensete ventricosum TaxID=4639 RepID=A0A427AEK6_ENSVE|nr:hypothetical protein B296_00032031 [Ensete ventricosum]RZS24279.1 hypothetical protein BHM03_00057353 [Ensete ventricosum]
MAATPDLLFGLRNSFYLGAYQAAINSSDIPNLPADDALERDVLVHQSYIALGSYQVPLSSFGSLLFDQGSRSLIGLHALNVQIFIKMHRSDYAEKQLKIMQQIDEDHTLTQLANAWLDLAMGGSKVQEAYLIFQDFSEKYQMTGTILNGKAVCCMHMNRFDEAESLLLEALNKVSF